MDEFYEKFFNIIRHSTDADLDTFQRFLGNAIKIERRDRKRSGLTIRQRISENVKTIGIPDNKKRYPKRLQYLQFVLSQDWGFLYDNSKYDDRKKYYVYAHASPKYNEFNLEELNIHGIPFYIGKGTGRRAWNLKRNTGHGLKVKEILGDGFRPESIVSIVKKDLSEAEALELESKLIYIFRTVYESQSYGILYNLEIGKRPDFKKPLKMAAPSSPVVVRRAAR